MEEETTSQQAFRAFQVYLNPTPTFIISNPFYPTETTYRRLEQDHSWEMQERIRQFEKEQDEKKENVSFHVCEKVEFTSEELANARASSECPSDFETVD